MDVEEFARRGNQAICDAEDLPEKAEDFAAGVIDRLQSMVEWATTHGHVTERMETALRNMEHGIEKWQR